MTNTGLEERIFFSVRETFPVLQCLRFLPSRMGCSSQELGDSVQVSGAIQADWHAFLMFFEVFQQCVFVLRGGFFSPDICAVNVAFRIQTVSALVVLKLLRHVLRRHCL